MHPCSGIIPSAHVQTHVGAACVLDCLTNGGVALLRVERQALFVLGSIAAAEVDFDEIKSALFEIKVGIVLVVVVKSHVHALCVAVVVVAAGVGTGIAVDASLQSLGVNIVGHRFQSVGKSCFVDDQFTCGGVASSKEAIVNVDVVKACILESFRHHGVGLFSDECIADVHIVSVPRAPSHRWATVVLSVCRCVGCK